MRAERQNVLRLAEKNSGEMRPVGSELLKPDELLTPSQLAERLQVKTSWIFEQTRTRAKVRNKKPLPCIRLGKYIRFSWPAVCEWLSSQNSD